MSDLIFLDVLTDSGEFRSRSPESVRDMTGNEVGQISLAPAPLVARTMSGLRRATPLSEAESSAVMTRAAEFFVSDNFDGLDYEQYLNVVSRTSGLGITTVREAADKIVRYCAASAFNADFARPREAMTSWSDSRLRVGGAMWVRRGSVFAVLPAGNHPGTNIAWLQAVALGYRVVVRPSRKEPFTPHRLVRALRAAGLSQDALALLSTNHDVTDSLIRDADLSLVYGGEEVMVKYAANPSVMRQGPGRSKILVTASADFEAAADLVADSIIGGGGVGCTNTTGVLVEGDVQGFARIVAERLAEVPSLSPQDPKAIFPTQQVANARKISDLVARVSSGTHAVLGSADVVSELGDGSAVMRPAIHVLKSASDSLLGLELPFPCAWFAPWNRDDDVEPLRNSLVVTALTRDEALLERLLLEPTIRNIYSGNVPTYWTAPDVPHDGFLADFLMESKGIRLTHSTSR